MKPGRRGLVDSLIDWLRRKGYDAVVERSRVTLRYALVMLYRPGHLMEQW